MNQASRKKKDTRISKLAQCIRRTTLSSKLSRTEMPDSPSANFDERSKDRSAKYAKLLTQIRELDKEDMETHKTKFKHFIFTDIRESAYGAKALASVLLGAGFEFRMAKQSKRIKRGGEMVETKEGETVFLDKPPVPGGCDGFAILQSLPLWKNPLSVKTKKDILRVFNSRPDNAHGERLRIVVLDSKFKEGIDLFDVKYVHLMEPPLAPSDLKQAVGRATRFCGQKGLTFVPRQGWPLEVYLYTSLLPNRPPFQVDTEEKDFVDAHTLMLAHSGLDVALLNLTKELTVLAISSAVDYDLNYKVNNFDIQTALLESTDLEGIVAEIDDFRIAKEAEVAEIAELAEQRSLEKKNAVLAKNVVLAETLQNGGGRLVAIHSPNDITPALLTKCSKRQSKLFPFSKQRLQRVADRLGMKVPSRAKRAWFCEQLTQSPRYLDAMLKPDTPDIQSIETLAGTPRTSPRSDVSNQSNANVALSRVKRLFPSPLEASPSRNVPPSLQSIANLPYQEFQHEITKLYEPYRWKSPSVRNGCEQSQAVSPGKPVSFTQTQDFVRHYLTPESPFKGLLAWHSVGTGKTCMAIAAATTEFEKAGYSILWVTRNSLMADVYKNMFGAVCSVPLIERIQEGWELPSDLNEQKRLLSRSWFPPISYRTFQNALQKKNELGRILYSKHPQDPLSKTFLIMDEIHKLQDGDLGPAESADFATIQEFLHKSYALSGKDSVRPLLMTATPITDKPSELFEILNTLIPNPEQRLLPFSEFRTKYTNTVGTISPEGVTYFQERAKGLISYLNREYDPSTFAQPRFHTLTVPIQDDFVHPLASLVERCVQPNEDAKQYEADVKAVNDSQRTEKQKKTERTRLKKAFLQTRKQRVKLAKACYASEKKRFTQRKSQLADVEDCFGKKASFVRLADFLAEVER